MSTRSNIRPQPVILNGDMSGNITSMPTVLQSLTIGSYTYSWAGTAPVGAVSIQLSNDYSLNPDGTVKNPGTWVTGYFTLNGTGAEVNFAPVTGNTGEGIIEWSTGAYAIRTLYVFTSGTGVLQAIVNGKVT
jgi:hypothetical protein